MRSRVLEAGLTLVELIIAFGISIVAGLLVMTILLNNNNLFYQQSQRVSAGIDLNGMISEINKSILMSQAVSATCPSPTPCPSSYVSSDSTLVLKLPYFDSSGALINGKNDYLVITQDPTNPKILRKYVFLYDSGSSRKGENRVLTTDLLLIKFLYLDSANPPQPTSPTSAFKVNFFINVAGVGLNPEVSSASGQVSLRNN